MNASVVARIVNIGLGIGAVVFVGLLAGVGSGALTNEPTADEINAYASTRSTTTAGGTGETTASPEATDARFVVTGVDFAAGTVAITNVGGAGGNLDGLWLCNFPTYTPISGSVDAGATVDVAFGVTAAGGEVGLYTSRSFGDSSAIISYVEWGSAGHERSAVAVAAGVWDGAAVQGDAGRLVAVAAEPNAAADWSAE